MWKIFIAGTTGFELSDRALIQLLDPTSFIIQKIVHQLEPHDELVFINKNGLLTEQEMLNIPVERVTFTQFIEELAEKHKNSLRQRDHAWEIFSSYVNNPSAMNC